ncbi:hypothetical protein [Roseibium sp.]|uniref:hypothetical protein n=1 Tax=Roseibium sp. TaxID=1936156 RepID=UPI00326355E4
MPEHLDGSINFSDYQSISIENPLIWAACSGFLGNIGRCAAISGPDGMTSEEFL